MHISLSSVPEECQPRGTRVLRLSVCTEGLRTLAAECSEAVAMHHDGHPAVDSDISQDMLWQ